MKIDTSAEFDTSAVGVKTVKTDDTAHIQALRATCERLTQRLQERNNELAKMEQRALAAECRKDALEYALVMMKNHIAELQTKQREFKFNEETREWEKVSLAV